AHGRRSRVRGLRSGAGRRSRGRRRARRSAAPCTVGEAPRAVGGGACVVGGGGDGNGIRSTTVGGAREVPRAPSARPSRCTEGRRARPRSGRGGGRAAAHRRRVHLPPRTLGAAPDYVIGVRAGLPSITARQFFTASVDIARRVSNEALAMCGAITTLADGSKPGWIVGSSSKTSR